MFIKSQRKETEEAEIRRLLGLDLKEIEAYNPKKAVEKVGKHWTVRLLGGQGNWLFKTKKGALVAAITYKTFLKEQFNNPCVYFDVVSLRAQRRLALLAKYEKEGLTEQEAADKIRTEDPRLL